MNLRTILHRVLPRWTHRLVDELLWRRHCYQATDRIMAGLRADPTLRAAGVTFLAHHDDRFTIELFDKPRVYWVSIGGQFDQAMWTSRLFEGPRDYLGFHLSEFEDKTPKPTAAWTDLQNAQIRKFVDGIMSRRDRVAEEAGDGAVVHAAVWMTPEVWGWFEDDNSFAHFMLRLQASVVAVAPDRVRSDGWALRLRARARRA